MKLFSKLPLLLASIFFALAIYVITTSKPKIKKRVRYEVNIAKDVAPHVVAFKSPLYGYRRLATGFYLKIYGKNFIVTNRHVCEINGKKEGDALIFGNAVETIIKIDTQHDLCLVTSHRTDGLELAEETPARLEDIYLIGFPRGIGKVIRKGHIIEEATIDAHWLKLVVPAYHISTIAYGGNSGSPVVNKYGEVIGVLFAGSPRYITEGFMVPLPNLKDFLYGALIE